LGGFFRIGGEHIPATVHGLRRVGVGLLDQVRASCRKPRWGPACRGRFPFDRGGASPRRRRGRI